jgi:Tfp pilus assembly protein PilX
VNGYSRIWPRREGEQGAALPIALAILIVCTMVTGVIVQYTSTGTRASAALASERNNVYAADGAVDAAIKWVQSDGSFQRGNYDDSDPNCKAAATGNTFFTTQVNGQTVNVTCQNKPNAAGGGVETMSPGFSVLTLAPYNGIAPTSGCNNTRDELGLVQVQSDKLLTIHGDVYINSDADSDIWSGGCPQLSSAKHIQVINGEVLQRASMHDVDACPNLHNHTTDCNLANNNVGLPDPLSAADAAKLQDPGLGPNAGQWAPNITDSTIPAVQTVPACPAKNGAGYRLVPFLPGTYDDAAALSTLMNGSCDSAVFWFQPGNYYFNFTNAGSHEWTINDTTTRIVGGQPTAVATDGQQVQGTWKPTGTSNVSVFQNPANGLNIDPLTADATFSSGSAAMTVNGFQPPAGQGLIPADATINNVTLRLSHGESNTALVNTPTYTITPGGGSPACSGLPALTKHTAVAEDVIDVTSCLNTPLKLNSGLSVRYSVSKCSTSGCSGSVTDRLNGVWLAVDYSTGGRPAWDPNDTSTVNGSSPAVPGGCRHELDPGWSDGVQWVMGGDSHINLKAGKLELCNQKSTTRQEIVLYGLRGGAAGPSVGPTAWPAVTITNPATNGFDAATYVNGRVVDNVDAVATLNSSATKTVTSSQFSPTGAWPIAAANQVPVGSTITNVTLRIAHWESSTSGVNTPTYTITPGGTATACTGLPAMTRRSSRTTDSFNVTSCLNTPDKLNLGASIAYAVSRNGTTNRTAMLDGMTLDVTYTAPAAGGGLAPGSGCVTQAPYYNPPGGNDGPDHEPGYNGACALVKVARDVDGGSYPRIVAFWGTVYAPSAALDLPVDVLTVPVFNRGVVARMLMLGYNIATDAPAPVATEVLIDSLQNRRMELTATVGGSQVKAEVEFCDHDWTPCNGTPNGVKVRSWRVVR